MTKHAINYGARARLGMLLASGNQAAEPQFWAMLPQGVSLHTTRLKLTGSSEQDLLSSVARVEDAAALVADAGVNLILFQMTAVATFSAKLEESILQRIALASGKPVTATSEALIAALRALSAKRIVMVSPYSRPINEREAAYLRGFGFEVLGLAGLDCSTASAMMAVTPQRWKSFTLDHRDQRADAYVVSCTTVRSADVAQELEQELGRPVVTSNTAAAWHCMRKMGIPDRVSGFGRLLSQH